MNPTEIYSHLVTYDFPAAGVALGSSLAAVDYTTFSHIEHVPDWWCKIEILPHTVYAGKWLYIVVVVVSRRIKYWHRGLVSSDNFNTQDFPFARSISRCQRVFTITKQSSRQRQMIDGDGVDAHKA